MAGKSEKKARGNYSTQPSVRRSALPIRINRKTPPLQLRPFADYFKGFEKVQAVRSVFGDETEAVLANLKVSFISLKFMYMGIRDEDGSISVGAYHLAHSDLKTLYLDIVHELFHIKQWREDRKSFELEHQRFTGDWSLYFSSPIEVPAYIHTVREAERIGMGRDEIVEHLKMGPTSPKIFAAFLKAMKLAPTRAPRRRVRLPVRINRKAPLILHPFTDFFKGFDKVPSVRSLLGKGTKRCLEELKIEFVHVSFMQIIPGDDGHIIVSVPYLKKAASASIYLDVLLCLNIMKRLPEGYAIPRTGEIKYSRALLDSYRAMLEEARRLGVPDAGVLEHMGIPQFLMSPSDYQRFLLKLELKPPTK